MEKFKNKAIVITGGNSGIGYATAKEFIKQGATVLNMPNSSAYSASKSAISHLAKITAKELAPRKIRVNTVNPGPTLTEMQSKFGMDEATLNGMKSMIISQVPLEKMGVPQDVAKMIVYLSDGDISTYITGAEFFIDGGMSL